jgi:hypothetical protein
VQNDPGPLWQSSSRRTKSLELAAARKNAGPTQTNSTYLLATDKEKAAIRRVAAIWRKKYCRSAHNGGNDYAVS